MLERNEKQALFFVVLVMLAVLSCRQVFAQMSVTGAVSGTIMDASGAMVPGATVKLTSETTRQARETKSAQASGATVKLTSERPRRLAKR